MVNDLVTFPKLVAYKFSKYQYCEQYEKTLQEERARLCEAYIANEKDLYLYKRKEEHQIRRARPQGSEGPKLTDVETRASLNRMRKRSFKIYRFLREGRHLL